MDQQTIRKNLNNFIFSSSAGSELKAILNHENQKLVSQFKNIKDFWEQRHHTSLSMKQQMRINAMRYAEGWKILQKSDNFRKLFKEIDYSAQVYGISLSTQAFLVTIQLLGTKEQVKQWQDLIYNGIVIGAYGQTQLGHGSNVQKLETTAHYDQKSQKFILNSPKITSGKFWPGVLGIFCTHAVVQARAFVKGKSIGIQTFIVEVRDNHLQPLQGIEAGDIGPKLGFIRVDNGYLRMNNVSIPRQNLLMKYVKVEKDGTVSGLQNKNTIKYAYGSMLNLRVRLLDAFTLGYTLTPSVDMLNISQKLQTQQNLQWKKKIIEGMAASYGYVIANNQTRKIFNQFLAELQNENYDAADQLLVSCHIISSTFKALASWKAMQVTSDYIGFNRLAVMRGIKVMYGFCQGMPATTYEGDNSVLLQQTAKYVLMKEAEDGDKVFQKPNNPINPSNLQNALKALQYVTSFETKRIKDLFEKSSENNIGFNTFWNEIYQTELIQVSKLWGYKVCIQGLIKSLDEIPNKNQFPIYEKICKIFCSVILKDAYQLGHYGIQIQSSNQWQKITKEQYRAMAYLDMPLQRGEQFMSQFRKNSLFPLRNADWLKPRL